MDHQKYLSQQAVAEMLGVTEGTLANWRWRKIGPSYYRVGSSIWYDPNDVERWIESRRVATADDSESQSSL